MRIAFYPNGYKHQTPEVLRVDTDILSNRNDLAILVDSLPANKHGDSKQQFDKFKSTPPLCPSGSFNYFKHCDNLDTIYLKSEKGFCEVEVESVDDSILDDVTIVTIDGREYIHFPTE